MSTIELPQLLTVASPAAFLATYEFMLRNQRSSKRAVLVTRTKRLLQLYLASEAELNKARHSGLINIRSWFKARKNISVLKSRVAALKNELYVWVYKTIRFFVGAELPGARD